MSSKALDVKVNVEEKPENTSSATTSAKPSGTGSAITTSPNAEVAMQLIYPKEPTRIYVPVDLDGTLSKTVFTIAHRLQNIKIHWHLDEYYIGSTTDFHNMELSPTAGRHKLALVDEKGGRLELDFEIIEK